MFRVEGCSSPNLPSLEIPPPGLGGTIEIRLARSERVAYTVALVAREADEAIVSLSVASRHDSGTHAFEAFIETIRSEIAHDSGESRLGRFFRYMNELRTIDGFSAPWIRGAMRVNLSRARMI